MNHKQIINKNLIFGIIIILLLNSIQAKTIWIKKIGRVKSDTSFIKVRMPSHAQINQFKSKKEFQYNREDKIQQFFKSINKRINDFFSNIFKNINWTPPAWVNYQNIIILFSLIIFLVLIYMTLKSNAEGLFYKTNNRDIFNNGVFIENIETVDFDSLIKKFLKNEDYRMAVRMLYHKILKELNIAKFITWKLDKTNDDYINEIKNDLIKSNFKELTHFFNYVWYGMFSINQNEFHEINNKFDQFILEINRGL